MNIGERVREKRQGLKVTQQELAKAIGVTPQHISAIEEGKRQPSLALLASLAQELGTSVDYLVSGKEGIVTDAIPAIKADRKLSLEAKKALVIVIEELYKTAKSEDKC